MKRKTLISIEGPSFFINGQPTYPGRWYEGFKIEGLLFNARMVQGIFDDLNPRTRSRWNYPDGSWDATRNTEEFVAAMPSWRASGLLSFTINLQGGSPEGYSQHQPWHNSAFEADGRLRDDYLVRLEKILDKADELGMAPIVGFFYFGQDWRLADEQAVIRATENAADWLLERGYTHVLVEIGNEVDLAYYKHDIIRASPSPPEGKLREAISSSLKIASSPSLRSGLRLASLLARTGHALWFLSYGITL